MCVCAVGSPSKEPIGMNEEFGKCSNDGQGNYPQPHYDFYAQGITEAHKGWIEVVIASIKNARGKYLVAVVAVWALYKVACEFIESGSNHLYNKSFIGALLAAGMVLTLGLIAILRDEGTNAGQKEKGKKDEIESAESGTGGISPSQNRRPSTRNGGSNLNGGGK
jgi:hypothetical protein